MKLYVDATDAERLWLGLEQRHKRVAESFSVSFGEHGSMLLALIDQFLRRHHAVFTAGMHLYIVAGPGRFTSLRITAVIANVVSWVSGVQLFSAECSSVPLADAESRIADLEQRCRPVRRIHPLYGRPPHITKSHNT